MKILVYGSLNIDITYSLAHIVRPGETLASTSVRRSAGGKGANQAVALAKAFGASGSKVYFAGKIGSDGDWALERLSSYGVDVSHVRHTETGTGQAIIQLDNDGQNGIILYGGGNLENETEEMDSVLCDFDEGDVLVMNAEISNLDHLMQAALKRGLRVCVNPSPITDDLLKLPLGKASMLVLNEVEGSALADAKPGSTYIEILNSLMKRYPAAEIILTIGEYGAYYGYKDTIEHSSAFDASVVDTTCAGDTFLGYYLASRLTGKKVRTALENGCKASSITVSRKGAMDSIPMAEEVALIPDRA